MEINIHFGLINKSACAHAHSHYFPKWVLLFYCLYPQKTELVSTAKLPLGNGWIVHLRESDKCVLNTSYNLINLMYTIRFRFKLQNTR